MKSAATCFNPSLVGQDEIIAGRKTYQIALGPSGCPSVAAATFNGPQTLWIDQETFFVLKWETRDPNDRRLIRTMEVSEIYYNPPLSADLFTFTPPSGAQVLDQRAGAPREQPDPLPSPTARPAQPTAIPTDRPLPFEPLLPAWLPEEMTANTQVDGEIVTFSFDPRPHDTPHAVLTLREMPISLITAGGSPDPQAAQEQIGEYEVTVIYRGQECITFEWDAADLHLQLTNPYDPPGQPRYTCEQMREVVESIH